MKVIAVNGSPRKKNNTATLLQHALKGAESVGAETETVHLNDLNFKGCVSCFACKRKNGHPGKCAVKDDLAPVLEKVSKADGLVLGSPIYLADVTAATRAFIERLIFPNISYDDYGQSYFEGSLSCAMIYTMNVPEQYGEMYKYAYEVIESSLQRCLKGETFSLKSYDTWQFDDYSKYFAANFDGKHKAEVHETQFPEDCRAAFELGVKLGSKK